MSILNTSSQDEIISFLSKALDKIGYYLVVVPEFTNWGKFEHRISTCTTFNLFKDEEIFFNLMELVSSSFSWNVQIRKQTYDEMSRKALEDCSDQDMLILQMDTLVYLLSECNSMSLNSEVDSTNQPLQYIKEMKTPPSNKIQNILGLKKPIPSRSRAQLFQPTHVSPEVVVNSNLDPETPVFEPKSFRNLRHNHYKKTGATKHSSKSAQHHTVESTRKRISTPLTHVAPEVEVNFRLNPEAPVYEPKSSQNLNHNHGRQSIASGQSFESGQHPKDEERVKKISNQPTNVLSKGVVNIDLDPEAPVFEPKCLPNLPRKHYKKTVAEGSSSKSDLHPTDTRFQLRTRNFEPSLDVVKTNKSKKEKNKSSANISCGDEKYTSACSIDGPNLDHQFVNKSLSNLKLEDKHSFAQRQAQGSALSSVKAKKIVSRSYQAPSSVSPFVPPENSPTPFEHVKCSASASEQVQSNVSPSEQVESSATSVPKQRGHRKKKKS